jgi:hypothetical protein
LSEAGIAVARQAATPIMFMGVPVGDEFKADIVVGRQVKLDIRP